MVQYFFPLRLIRHIFLFDFPTRVYFILFFKLFFIYYFIIIIIYLASFYLDSESCKKTDQLQEGVVIISLIISE